MTRFDTERLPGLKRFMRETNKHPIHASVAPRPDAFPRRLREQRRLQTMPDFLGLAYWEGVCEKFRSWVAELDPGIHQFFERIGTLCKDGQSVEKTYYAINPRQYFSGTTLPERATAREVRYAGVQLSMCALRRLKDHLEFDALRINGRRLWVDTDISSVCWFISDELEKRIIKAKLKKLGLVHHRLGRR